MLLFTFQCIIRYTEEVISVARNSDYPFIQQISVVGKSVVNYQDHTMLVYRLSMASNPYAATH